MPTLKIGINDLASVSPEFVDEWNYQKNDALLPEMIAAGSHKKVWWICAKGHEWKSSPNNRRHGNGCPYYSGRLPIKGETDLKTVFPDIANEWNYEKNKDLFPENVTFGSSKKVWWKCAKGHEWESTIAHRAGGRGCPICNREVSTSFPEQAVFYYIKQIFPDAINRYKPEWLIGDKNALLEIDIFIPSINVGIDYDGQAYHTDANKDTKKDKIIDEHGVLLIRIREPKCPTIDSSSKCVHISSISGVFYYEDAIKQLLAFVREKFNLNFIIDVDIKRDYSSINNSFEHINKEQAIAFTNPDLILEWDSNRNGKLTPYNVSSGSNKRIHWQCEKCGFCWIETPKHRSSGRGCPSCATHNRIKTRIGNIIERTGNSFLSWCEDNGEWGHTLLSEWSINNTITPDNITSGSSQKVWWKCENAHIWQATINARVHGAKCPYCTNKLTLSGYNDLATLFPNLMSEWIYERNTINPHMIRAGSNSKVWWKCKKCGYEWQAAVCNRTKNQAGCPYCAGHVVISGKNDLATLHDELLVEWNYDKNELNPQLVSPGSSKKVWWICKKCTYEWYASIVDRTHGHGCPRCAKSKAGKSKKKTT